MSRDHQPEPWTTRGMLAHLFPRRQKLSPAISRQTLATQLLTRQLVEMALARFHWSGLPESVNPVWLEHLLISHGQAVVGRDPRNGALVGLQVSTVSPANYQNEHAVVRGHATNYESAEFITTRQHLMVAGKPVVNEANGVVVYNNATRSGDLALIQYYADRLAELDTTIDINSMNMRRNKVVYADDATQLAVNNILSEIAQGEPVIRARRPLEGIVQTLDLSVDPDSVDRLHIFRGRMFNEAMMALGIDNTNQDKKERMVTDELGGNDDQVARIRSAALNQRRMAALKISRVYGKPVTVDYNVIDDPGNDPIVEHQTANTETPNGGDTDVHDATV